MCSESPGFDPVRARGRNILGAVYSPKLTYTARLDYAWKLGNGATVRPSVNFSHTDLQYSTLFQDAFFAIDARNLLGASVSYELDTWQLQA